MRARALRMDSRPCCGAGSAQPSAGRGQGVGSASLKAEAERVVIAEGVKQQAGALPNPEVQFQNENLRRGQHYGTDVDTLAYVIQPLDVLGKRRRRVDAAEQGVVRTQAEYDQARWQTVRDVKLAYWDARGAQEARDLLKATVDTFQQLVDYHNARLSVGAIAEQDVLRVRLEGERLQITANLAALRATRAQAALLKAMGQSDLSELALTEPIDAGVAATATVEEVLAQRPDMKVARAAVAEAEARARLQDALARPDLSVTYGYKRTQLPGTLVGANTSIAAVTVKVPLFDRNAGNRAAAAAEARRQEQLLTATQVGVVADFRAASQEYELRRREVVGDAAAAARARRQHFLHRPGRVHAGRRRSASPARRAARGSTPSSPGSKAWSSTSRASSTSRRRKESRDEASGSGDRGGCDRRGVQSRRSTRGADGIDGGAHGSRAVAGRAARRADRDAAGQDERRARDRSSAGVDCACRQSQLARRRPNRRPRRGGDGRGRRLRSARGRCSRGITPTRSATRARAITRRRRSSRARRRARRSRSATADRAETLLDLKAGSQQQAEQARQDLVAAQTAVRNAQLEVDRLKDLLEDDLRVPADPKPGDETADQVPIIAPASGYILEKNVTLGKAIDTMDDTFVIGDLSQVWMLASVRQDQLGQLRMGQPVRVTVAGVAGQAFEGKIANLGQQLDPSTRTMQVRIVLGNSGNALRPGMLATAEIPAGESRMTVLVPSDAVQQIDGQDVVFVRVAPDRFAVRAVETAETANGETPIRQGLKGGEQVVVKGSFVLKSQLLRAAIEEGE